MDLKEIEELANEYYNSLAEDSKLKDDFEQVLIKYLMFHVPNLDSDSFFCSIHQNFKEGHNCVACNLQYTNERIINFLYSYRTFQDVNTTFSIFLMLLYLQVECILGYMKMVKIPEVVISEKFKTLIEIKRWANFLKHPKSFLLVHHPYWSYEQDLFEEIEKSDKVVIDSAFINKYYKGDKKNECLYETLKSKEDLVVLFPNPYELISDYCETQKDFMALISSDKSVRNILEDEASIQKYFENEIE